MNIERLGDPHLGKSFTNGVPLHRRGERELTQWRDFSDSLWKKVDLHVCMGDLFDKMVVPYSVVLTAAERYRQVANEHPEREFVVIRGNHDASKDNHIVTAYDVFAALMEGVKNVHVLQGSPFVLDEFCFIPWQPHRRAGDVIPTKGHFREVYGHWDCIDFGDDNHNLIPLEKLKEITEKVYTGHDHNSRVIHEGLVHVTGSMQPYSHAEDAEGKLYVTRSVDSLRADDNNRCVRLLLLPGEVVPADLDVLQLTVKRVTEDAEVPDAQLETFDLKAIFDEAMAGVSDELRAELWERMKQ